MPYVMVPVPEEFEREVTLEVFRMGLRTMAESWSPQFVADLVAAGDDGWRDLLRLLVEDFRSERLRGPAEVADELGIDVRALGERFRAIEAHCREHGQAVIIWTTPRTSADTAFEVVESVFVPRHAADLLAGPLGIAPAAPDA